MSQAATDKAKEEFDLLVQHVTDTHKSFVDNTAKVAGFLLLAIGWLATASDARTFLSGNKGFACIAAIAVAAAYFLSVWASKIAYNASRRAIGRLGELSYLPPSAYRDRALNQSTFAVCVVGNGVLAAVLVVGLLIA